MGTALSAIHDRLKTPWTVESLAEAAGMSRSAFAARFKELLGQTPLEYVTEWRMQKAMQLLEQRDKKLIDVARSVGYDPTPRSARRSSELSEPTLANSSNVVLKAAGMSERRQIQGQCRPDGACPPINPVESARWSRLISPMVN
jgi:AraC-like DNA-binding protein